MKFQTHAIARFLLMLTIVVLVVFGIASLLRIVDNPGRAVLYSIYALIMLGDGAVLAFCAWQLARGVGYAFRVTVAVLALNILLTFFDQVGWIDVSFILLNLITLILFIRSRKEFIPA